MGYHFKLLYYLYTRLYLFPIKVKYYVLFCLHFYLPVRLLQESIPFSDSEDDDDDDDEEDEMSEDEKPVPVPAKVCVI